LEQLDGGQWQFAAIQLLQHRLQTFGTFNAMLSVGALPDEKKTIIILRRYRLNFSPEPVDRESMNSRQQAPIAPFLIVGVRVKFSTQNKAFSFERKKSRVDFGARQGQDVRQIASCDWSTNLYSSPNQFAN